MQLLLESVWLLSIASTWNPVLLTSKSKGMFYYLVVLTAFCLKGYPSRVVTANWTCSLSTLRGSRRNRNITFLSSLSRMDCSSCFLIIWHLVLTNSIFLLFILTSTVLLFYFYINVPLSQCSRHSWPRWCFPPFLTRCSIFLFCAWWAISAP